MFEKQNKTWAITWSMYSPSFPFFTFSSASDSKPSTESHSRRIYLIRVKVSLKIAKLLYKYLLNLMRLTQMHCYVCVMASNPLSFHV